MRLSGLIAVSFSLLISTSSIEASPYVKRASSLITNAASLNNGNYDYIIVGGGASGLAAAYELSKDASKKVLVIEAGGDPRQNPKVSSNNAYGNAFDDSQLDWPASTVPQQSAGGKSFPTHAGKGIGGSTNINGGAFSVPPSSQIDALGQLSNQQGAWNDLQPFLKNYQKYQAPSSSQVAFGVAYDQASHSNNGQVDIGFPSQMRKDAQDDAFMQSVRGQLNLSPSGDLGSGRVSGSGYIAKFCKADDGDRRVSAATAFFSPVESVRSNLAVLINARATKIIWQQTSSPAIAKGAQYQTSSNGPTYSVFTKKVIIAAGALRSPKFLEMSGVGDSKILGKIGVQQVVNLPGVGANLIDQIKSQVIAGGPNNGNVQPDGFNNAVAFPSLRQLMSNATDVKAYMERNIDTWAQAAVNKGGSVSKAGLLLQYRAMIDGIFNQNWPAAEFFWIPTSSNTILEAWNLLTFSRGSVHAVSASAWSRSDIDPNFFGASIDIDLQIAAMRGARKTMQGQALVNVISGPEFQPGFDASNNGIPQTNGGAYGRYDRWQKYISDTGSAVWHFIGSCSMMPLNLGGVVGTDFKVHQTSNVYVIDASVITLPLGSHITSVVYAMAIKAATIIAKA